MFKSSVNVSKDINCLKITESYKKIGFSDLTTQGMPFYGGNLYIKQKLKPLNVIC